MPSGRFHTQRGQCGTQRTELQSAQNCFVYRSHKPRAVWRGLKVDVDVSLNLFQQRQWKLKIMCYVALLSAMLFLLLFMQSQQLEGNVWIRNHWQPSDTVYSVHEETSIHICFVPVHGCVYNKPHLNFMQCSRKAVELQMLSSLQHLKGICYGF